MIQKSFAIFSLAIVILTGVFFVVPGAMAQYKSTKPQLQVKQDGSPLITTFQEPQPIECPAGYPDEYRKQGSKDCVAITWIADYIVALYRWLVSIVGILAVAIGVWAGIKWMASAGNPEQVNSAKEQIMNAVIGILLLLGSYVFLNTVNPSLTKLKGVIIPGITKKELPKGSSTFGGSSGFAGNTGLPWCPNEGEYQGKFNCGGVLKAGTELGGNKKVEFTCIGSHCAARNTIKYGCLQTTLDPPRFDCMSENECPDRCVGIKERFGASWTSICASRFCEAKTGPCYIHDEPIDAFDACIAKGKEGELCNLSDAPSSCQEGFTCNPDPKTGDRNQDKTRCVKDRTLDYHDACQSGTVCKSGICSNGLCTEVGGNQGGSNCVNDADCGSTLEPPSGRVCNQARGGWAVSAKCDVSHSLNTGAACDRPGLCIKDACVNSKCL